MRPASTVLIMQLSNSRMIIFENNAIILEIIDNNYRKCYFINKNFNFYI